MSGIGIGIDFGTTNTTLAYLDRDDGEPKAFRYGGAAAREYVPSFLAIAREDREEVAIGAAARAKLGDSQDYAVYSRFKMLLGSTDPRWLRESGFGDGPPTPAQVAALYLRRLIDAYRGEMGVGRLGTVVVTVPHIWKGEGRHSAQDAVKDLKDQIGLPRLQLVSEPVAATVWFAKSWQRRQGSGFQGHVVVCDLGGGTLDFSLAQVDGMDIKVLGGAGRGTPTVTLGTAGVAYDEAVVRRVLGRAGRLPAERPALDLAIREFENRKIEDKEALDRRLEPYLRDASTDRKAFACCGETFLVSDLVAVYRELIEPEILKALESIRGQMQAAAVAGIDPACFRVLMVGGFSNFILCRQTIRRFFGGESTQDRRFDTAFNAMDTALAIAMGAALIANEQSRVEYACPITVGVQAKDPNRDFAKVDIPILRKGEEASRYRQPCFAAQRFEVLAQRSFQGGLTLFFDVGQNRRRYLRVVGTLRELFPSTDGGKRWRIGFSIDQDQLFHLHIQDEGGQEKVTPLGDLEKKIEGLIVSEG